MDIKLVNWIMKTNGYWIGIWIILDKCGYVVKVVNWIFGSNSPLMKLKENATN